MKSSTAETKSTAKRPERMLDQLRTEVADIKIEKFCLNTLVNVIASNKANECRKNDIAYDFDLNVPRFVGIEDVDICKAYVNIFDNAINAAKSSRREQIYKDKKLCRQKRRNVIYQQRKRRRTRLRRRKKKRTGDHGYGLKILEDTAENTEDMRRRIKAAVYSPAFFAARA